MKPHIALLPAVFVLLQSCQTETVSTSVISFGGNPLSETHVAAALVKLEIIEQPAVVVVGKSVRFNPNSSNAERLPQKLWSRCMADGTFDTLEALSGFVHDPAYVGYMDNYDSATGAFDYICGMLMKPGVPVPGGFAARRLPPAKVAVGWIKGLKENEGEIYSNAHTLMFRTLGRKGMKPLRRGFWSMEVYTSPRFTAPDENGFIIMDYYLPIE